MTVLMGLSTKSVEMCARLRCRLASFGIMTVLYATYGTQNRVSSQTMTRRIEGFSQKQNVMPSQVETSVVYGIVGSAIAVVAELVDAQR